MKKYKSAKISVIFGTRPEAIKLAPVILELGKYRKIDCQVCVTGQHREMLDQVLEAFEIIPDVDMNLMQPRQTLAELTSKATERIDAYLTKEKPDFVIVQGDTTTTFVASLVSFYHRIPIGHVEAGLRTGNFLAPWPEEANRVLTTRLAALHFAPTETNRQNLLKEGIPADKIFVTGNTVIDAVLIALKKVKDKEPAIPGLDLVRNASSQDKPIVLITGHRRESFGEGFESICRGIATLARQFPRVQFVYPVHLNPHVREPVMRILGNSTQEGKRFTNVHLIDPLPYLPFVALMDRARLILTDSGGIQEEAPSLGKPVLVMRDTTERPEAVMAGTVKLVGTDQERIVEETSLLLTDPHAYARMARRQNPYGDGRAADRIVKILLQFLFRSSGKQALN